MALLVFLLVSNGLSAEDHPFPYALNNKDCLLLPLGLGLSLLGDSLSGNRQPLDFEEIGALDRNDVNAFDRPATYNWSFKWEERSDRYRDILAQATLLSLSLVPLLHAKLSQTATVGVMFIESYLILRGLTYITKAAVGRRRPYLYNTDLSVEERYGIDVDEASSSFYSGHAAVAFTAATFLSKTFTDIHGRSTWSTLLWGSTLSLAALTGVARVKCGQHFPTDVIAGAAVGMAIGYLVPTLHKKAKRDRLSFVVSAHRISVRLSL